jgi:hypothetical protein
VVPLLYFVHELIDREIARNRGEQSLDRRLVTVNVKKPANNLWCSDGINTLHIDLDELGESVRI